MSVFDYRLPSFIDDGDITRAIRDAETNVLRVFHELWVEIAALAARVEKLEARDGRG